MAFYDQMLAALTTLFRGDAEPYMALADGLTIKKALTGLAPIAGAGVYAEQFAGAGIGATHTFAYAIESIPCILNITAGGAVTPLAVTTDYTFVGATLTWVTTQAGDTVVAFVIPSKSWA